MPLMPRPIRMLPAIAIAGVLAAFSVGAAHAQENLGGSSDLFGSGGGLLTGGKSELQVSATLTAGSAKPGSLATLAVTVRLPKDYYIYSTNPAFGGRTKLDITEAIGLEPVGDGFQASREPEKAFQTEFNQEVEKFYDQVIWSHQFRIAKDADPASIKVSGTLGGQYCKSGTGGNCVLIRPAREFSAELVTELAKSPASFELTPTRGAAGNEKPDPVKFRFVLQPPDAKPGDIVTMSISAAVDEGWHTFGLDQDPAMAGLPTVIDAAELKNLKPLEDAFQPTPDPQTETKGNYTQRTHYGVVTWTRRFEVQPAATDEGYGVAGTLRYQLCEDNRCLSPRPIPFALGQADGTAPLEPIAADAGGRLPAAEPLVIGDLIWYLALAFAGGLILNVMPCVLPVIAIKVMSFVQQAGESRGRILQLNLVYALGVLSVFWLLATLAAGPRVLETLGFSHAFLDSIGFSDKFGWGGLFQKDGFNFVMACVIFAMGLSLLGVFEIPVPGFVGSAAGAQQREGLVGAFLTGILATLLATPCSGPFLGVTLGWSVKQSAPIIYLVWTFMGLGMALPYVIFGFFPGAIRYLPRPGMWMVRMKEFAGFVLLGTVLFIMSYVSPSHVMPLLISLLGIALGLWMIGNLYDANTKIKHKMAVRLTALTLSGAICYFGFALTQESPYKLPWQNFSEQNLQAAMSEKKTVLVDFTAQWCLTCKANERFALNTEDTLELVKEHGIVPLYADYTDESDEIRRWLEKYESISVPLTVIFPAGKPPEQAIVLRDVYTQGQLLDSLRQAVGTTADQEARRTIEAAVR